MNATYVMPTSATTKPTGAKSNILYGAPSACSRKVAMTMLGGVPISVTMPPRIEANESGMSVSAGLRFALAAAWTSTGINSARAATLFMAAESPAAMADMIPMCMERPRDSLMRCRARTSMAPDQ